MNRNDRRTQRKTVLGAVAAHPASRRLLSNYKKYGRAGAEIFIQQDDGSGKPRYFDVFSARLWCSKHNTPVPLAIDLDLVSQLERNGSVDADHLATKRFDKDVAPIIVCRQASRSGYQLIDGAHRYVAFVREIRAKGLETSITHVPAYILEPTNWKRFVVPEAVAKAFRFDDR